MEHKHHGPDCGCGHEHHDHGHHDPHGPDCGCGHEHHDHKHHGHHDHHEHGAGAISISYHETSLIGAVEGRMVSGNYESACRDLAREMREASRRVVELGGFVGHIKFIVSHETGGCQISVTDVDDTARELALDRCRMEGVAIVFLIGEEELCKILRETVGTLLAQ